MALQRYLKILPHIGDQRDKKLRLEGCHCWKDVLDAPRPLAGFDVFAWDEIREVAEACLRAVQADDVAYFTSRLPVLEQWRVLTQWFDQVSFFDIETSGLEVDSIVTLVCCFHDGQPLRFLANENLDEFLDLLENVRLLASFNGASFDVPRVLDRFHIPELPCPHVDLRWLCHHVGWRGGLKKIERGLGLRRPPDLEGLGGAEAVWLWQAWTENHDARARRTLERYCAADTVMLKMLAGKLCALQGGDVVIPEEAVLWRLVHESLPDMGRTQGAGSIPRAVVEPPQPKPTPAPVVSADLFSISELVGSAEGLSRAEKQARLRERWRLYRGGA